MTIEPKAKRAAMDRGPWSFGTPDPPAGSVDIQGAECRCDDVDDTTDPPAAVMCPKLERPRMRSAVRPQAPRYGSGPVTGRSENMLTPSV